MHEDPSDLYRRWIDSDQAGLDDEAEDAFRALASKALTPVRTSAGFEARTMAAVAEARAVDATRMKRVRWAAAAGGTGGTAVGLYFGGHLLVSGLSAAFIWAINLVVGTTVRMASGVGTGVDVWASLSSAGRAVAALAADPTVTFVLLALQGVAIVALFALQRLLGSDGEVFK